MTKSKWEVVDTRSCKVSESGEVVKDRSTVERQSVVLLTVDWTWNMVRKQKFNVTEVFWWWQFSFIIQNILAMSLLNAWHLNTFEMPELYSDWPSFQKWLRTMSLNSFPLRVLSNKSIFSLNVIYEKIGYWRFVGGVRVIPFRVAFYN